MMLKSLPGRMTSGRSIGRDKTPGGFRSRTPQHPTGAAWEEVCFGEEANGAEERRWGSRAAPPPPFDPIRTPNRLSNPAAGYFGSLSRPTYAILRPAAESNFLLFFK
jgi:hypothetical protein